MDQNIKTICDDTCCTCDRSQPIIKLLAKLPNGTRVSPQGIGDRFYGTAHVAPQSAFEHGLPIKGYCADLLRHARRGQESAFRGTTERAVISHSQGQGAIYWADEDGWVYELGELSGWDVEQLLEGIVPTPAGFTGVPYPGELECAIHSRISPAMIRRAAQVFKGRRCLELGEWKVNRNYRAAKFRNSKIDGDLG
ncbi:hypothetical protein BV321_01279 [Pseudomonas syringae pv. actinidiae]|nr:hypothetical protein [Pseudomonas savastanoi pv. phaseolicola]OSN37333.1 hypothetical protein BV343_01122 [Pseudomonas syringae pv. actinidiae]RMR93446.1 hypothetical protein ALP76_00918 [Pseudomonas savastanoi pv. glycinea]OSN45083.1 hypothetical protein BV344_01125 [Pseudomonas syringae pv. actinidiae]OSR31885.1 hypothetical protein BV320_05098 [Pseudomonas syringae pv. actinidiae]